MSDHYLALIDPAATAADARVKADKLLQAFVACGVVLPDSSDECTLGGPGYPPGPRLNEYYFLTIKNSGTGTNSRLAASKSFQANG